MSDQLPLLMSSYAVRIGLKGVNVEYPGRHLIHLIQVSK